MNTSNTEQAQPAPATNRVVHSVETPVDNREYAGEVQRILVIGSATWPWPDTVSSALVSWWDGAGNPVPHLVVDGRGPFAEMVTGIWNRRRFGHEMHTLQPHTRNPERKLKRVMTVESPAHVLVFRHGNDPYVIEWIDYLHELVTALQAEGLVPPSVTIIQIDEVTHV